MKLDPRFLTLAVIAVSSPAWAAEEPTSADERLAQALERKIEKSNELRSIGATPTVAASDVSGPAWKWGVGAGGFALILVVAAIWTKRQRESRMLAGDGAGLTIQESVWVGRGQRLLVVNAAGQRYLLGATGGGLETLAELGPAQAPTPAGSDLEPEPSVPSTPASFRDLVGEALASDSAPRRRRKEILEGLRAL